MRLRAVIFDFGGVLFKTHDYTPRHAWDDRLGLPRGAVERAVHNDESWRAAQHGTLSLADYWADVGRRLGISPAVAASELATDFYRGDVLDEQIVAYIRGLRQAGHAVALLSNDAAGLLRPRLDRLGIVGLFDPLVISSEIGVMKPASAAYQAVLEQLARPAPETVFIDDMPQNIAGARAVGMQAIRYQPQLELNTVLAPHLTL
jgi:HAD superfamily hydrolase (TIGR01509 family)